ncbi:MAG: DUF302 domain-containing protein [Deinococcota bacterium]
MPEFTISRRVDGNLTEALDRFKSALSNEGFGVLYELDFSEIIRNKTGQALTGRVVGLGVCSPGLAQQALSVDPAIAALLPCGAYVSEDNQGVTVGLLDPDAALGLAERPELQPLGQDARTRLKRALNSV